MSDATLDIAGAALRVGGQVVPVRVAGDGRVGVADGPMLAPVTFGDRWRAVRWAGAERDRGAALAAALVRLAGADAGDPDQRSASLDELLALLLAGAGTPAPSFAEAAAAAGRLGWGLAEVSAARAIDVDALAGPPATRREVGGWNRVVLIPESADRESRSADDELVAARDALAEDLFSRADAAPAETELDEPAPEEPAPGERVPSAAGVSSDPLGDLPISAAAPTTTPSPTATITATMMPALAPSSAPVPMDASRPRRAPSSNVVTAQVDRRARSRLRAVDLGQRRPSDRRSGLPPAPAGEVHPTSAAPSAVTAGVTTASHPASSPSSAPAADRAAERPDGRAPAIASRRAAGATMTVPVASVVDVARSPHHHSRPGPDRTMDLAHVVGVALAEALHREADRRGVSR